MEARDREQMGEAGIPHGLKHILGHRRLASRDEGDGDAGDIAIGNGGEDPALDQRPELREALPDRPEQRALAAGGRRHPDTAIADADGADAVEEQIAAKIIGARRHGARGRGQRRPHADAVAGNEERIVEGELEPDLGGRRRDTLDGHLVQAKAPARGQEFHLPHPPPHLHPLEPLGQHGGLDGGRAQLRRGKAQHRHEKAEAEEAKRGPAPEQNEKQGGRGQGREAQPERRLDGAGRNRGPPRPPSPPATRGPSDPARRPDCRRGWRSPAEEARPAAACPRHQPPSARVFHSSRILVQRLWGTAAPAADCRP